MKGTVVSSWIESCRRLFGDQAVNEAMEAHNVPVNRIFSPLEDVPDSVATGIVDTVGKKVGKDHKEIWEIMGQENIKTFNKNYPGFFRHESAYQFLKSMNDVHAIVMKHFKGATPPVLDMTPLSSHKARFTYRSPRGMGDYLNGLLHGVADRFHENIGIEVVNAQKDHIDFDLTFEKEIQTIKSHPFNRITSLGFIHSVSIKMGLLNGVLLGLVTFPILHNVFLSLIIAVVTFLLVSITEKLFRMPEKTIINEISRLGEGDYVESVHLKTSDLYEDLMHALNKIKRNTQKDFINFNSMVDEMSTFNSSVTTIASTMSSASSDITDILNMLSTAATTQAEDTEKSVSVITDSIASLNGIATESEDNKDKIEAAVNDIDNSFSSVTHTASEIGLILKKFGDIKDSAYDLREKAEGITQIVTIVSSIANHINLLALNASIEAARAGEAGKGFSVVAEEIRKLSTDTNQAVSDINNNLTSFVANIGGVVEGINSQYDVLERENGNLKQSVETSALSNENLNAVSLLLVHTSESLKTEATHISSLFDSLQSLAAIAEENSASTQEANSNVAIYVDHIQELTTQMSVFEGMIHNFQNDLKKYKI